ncbi:MAG: DnaJ domain-containing protein [Bryobacteraceae bacterium]
MTNPVPEEKRAQRRLPRARPLPVRITRSAAHAPVSAQLLDANEGGAGIQACAPLYPGEVVVIESLATEETIGGQLRARCAVRWCQPAGSSLYRAGLQFLPAEPVSNSEPATVDYYEVLQVNPKASLETIHRVYRILAQQFHPDNQETGDEKMFRQIVEAYRVLSDPEQRAAYDLSHAAMLHARWRVFQSPKAALGPGAEKRKRYGVLRALYAKRQQDPHAPGVTIFELEDLLGIPRDHLEFTLWYLKERGLLTRADNNRFQITAAGVDYAEQLEEQSGSAPPADDRLLPAPGQARF